MFISLLNSNYIVEIFENKSEIQTVSASLLTVFLGINRYRYVLYIILVLMMISLLYLNKKYLLGFLKNYSNELKLMARLNLKNKLKRSPLIYAAVFFNIISLISAWGLTFLIYKLARDFMVIKHLNIVLLEFNQFKLTLLLFLLIIGLGTGLPIAIYIFWSVSRKW